MRFKRLDLNLLVAFDTLLKERNVSRAARQLNLSQPAMSAAFGRLREYFNDEILVSYGKRMIPTAHAQSVAPMVAKALAGIDDLISASTVFDPATSQRTFRVCASDYVTVVLLAPLLSELEASAPGIRIEISSPSPEEQTKLDHGDIDFLLSPEEYLVKDHPKKLLFEEQHVVVGWKGNPIFRKPLTEQIFFEQRHIKVEISYVQTFVEEAMHALGRSRHVAVIAPSFHAVPWMLPGTMRVAVMLERLANLMTKRMPLAVAPLPFPFPTMREMIQYHVAKQTDSGVQWLLKRILEHAESLR